MDPSCSVNSGKLLKESAIRNITGAPNLKVFVGVYIFLVMIYAVWIQKGKNAIFIVCGLQYQYFSLS